MESQMAVVHHDLKGLRFALGLKPEDVAVGAEYGSMGFVVTNSKLVPNSVTFAAHRLWLAGRESCGRLVPSSFCDECCKANFQ
jgi:hypothetical protein